MIEVAATLIFERLNLLRSKTKFS